MLSITSEFSLHICRFLVRRRTATSTGASRETPAGKRMPGRRQTICTKCQVAGVLLRSFHRTSIVLSRFALLLPGKGIDSGQTHWNAHCLEKERQAVIFDIENCTCPPVLTILAKKCNHSTLSHTSLVALSVWVFQPSFQSTI